MNSKRTGRTFPFPDDVKARNREEYKAALKKFSEDEELRGWTLYAVPQDGIIILSFRDDDYAPEPVTYYEVTGDPDEMDRELSYGCDGFCEFVELGLKEDLTPEQWEILGIEP